MILYRTFGGGGRSVKMAERAAARASRRIKYMEEAFAKLSAFLKQTEDEAFREAYPYIMKNIERIGGYTDKHLKKLAGKYADAMEKKSLRRAHKPRLANSVQRLDDVPIYTKDKLTKESVFDPAGFLLQWDPVPHPEGMETMIKNTANEIMPPGAVNFVKERFPTSGSGYVTPETAFQKYIR